MQVLSVKGQHVVARPHLHHPGAPKAQMGALQIEIEVQQTCCPCDCMAGLKDELTSSKTSNLQDSNLRLNEQCPDCF